jgi:O-methyltransferase
MPHPDISPEVSSPNDGERLREIINGYQRTALIYAAVQLGIPDLLSNKRIGTTALAQQMGVHEGRLVRLLRALASVGIVSLQSNDDVSLTVLGSQLRSEASGSLAPMAIAAFEESFPAWSKLADAIRSGAAVFPKLFGQTPWEHRQRNPACNTAFNKWLNQETTEAAKDIIRAYDFSAAVEIADVAGGQGGLLATILNANPRLRGLLIDLPHVVNHLPSPIEELRRTGRCRVQPNDIFSEISAGADIYLLKSVLHDWPDPECQKILGNCRQAMQGRSRLLVIERALPEDAKLSQTLASLDLHMLVMFGSRERTVTEYKALAESSGLTLQRAVDTDAGWSILEFGVSV